MSEKTGSSFLLSFADELWTPVLFTIPIDRQPRQRWKGGAEVGECHVPVLIVGAGPVGLVLSLFLSKLGIKCAVVEKSITFSQHPQAHFINNRSMELFRKLDGLAEDIQGLQPPIDQWRKFVYCTSLSGTILGSVDHMRPQDFEKLVSPTSVAHFSQYKLTRLLVKKLENVGFRVCGSDESGLSDDMVFEKKILMGHECTSIHPFPQGVKVGASFYNDGKVMEKKIHCEILVGADGARSNVRKLVGIEMKGERNLQKLISVHFLSRDLGQFLLHERPGMLFFIFNPDAIGSLLPMISVPFYPPQQCLQDFSPRVCQEIICNLVGCKLPDVQIVDIKPWVMHAEVAERFDACDGRVILAGDAAHRFPPAGGFGKDEHWYQDAHNLAWKIAALFNGIASTSILQTYEMERRPIALFNTELSIQNFRAAMSIPAALGLDPAVADTVHEAINSSIGSILPSAVQKRVMEGIFAIGRAQVSESLLNENSPLMSWRLAKVRSILNEGKSLQLQFPAEDLGFRYLEGAMDSSVSGRIKDEESTSGCRGESRDYVPSSEPGSRIPHMPVRLLNASDDKDILSTLDLVPADKLEFLLIIAPVKESYDLALSAFRVARDFGVVLKVCTMWPHGSFDEHQSGSGRALEPWDNYMDVEERWAIMVRPDDHIVWRATAKVGNNAVDEMKRVFSRILGRSIVSE
ncbi:unnamed protein product [Spirodela intermedia]|uniref:FAD-binding domain-containing protein n=1 Tax=Spirodela intermedia TaxID=51605 RepID=A0A7I8IQ72_SPIIN|nr:unnamed protein product [Spirodela intermedia]CAA6660080.1 unnamed protein product [Spirodela intermedia]